jgi:hypothetical protein
MYLTWEYYLRTVLITGGNIALLAICQILSMLVGSYLFYLLEFLALFIFLLVLVDFDSNIPDTYHMTSKRKYRVAENDCIYVKMPFAWVRTRHTAKNGDLLPFQELKADYRHSGKGKTYEV